MERGTVKAAAYGLTLASVGALAKLLGGILYGSKALLVDGLTCIASLIAGGLLIFWLRRSGAPPDLDHPYGHLRLAYGAVSYTTVVYAFAAGVGFAYLLSVKRYTVDVEAVEYALVGLAFYSLAIIAYRRAGPAGGTVAAFTSSEILESSVSLLSAAGGAALSYIVDYAGAWVIEGFIVYETIKQAGELVISLSDRADAEALAVARRELESRGLRVQKLRLRSIVPGRYHGDAVVSPPAGMPPAVADILVDEAVANLESKGIDLTIHIDLTNAHSRDSSGDKRFKSVDGSV